MARYTISATFAEKDDGKKDDTASTHYSVFRTRHPTYNLDYWKRLDCLYKGGAELLEDRPLMEQIMPPHRGEHIQLYNERIACAHYIPFAGEIIGNTVMGVFSDPMTIGMTKEKAELPEFYAEFVEDTSRPGKKTKCSMEEFVSKLLLKALVKGCGWTQIDLPRVSGNFDSKRTEEQANANRCYLLFLDPENVTDWDVDEDGDLLWAITRKVTNRRSTPDSDRSIFTEEFTILDREEYQVFEITYKKDKPPEDKDLVYLIDQGTHTFGAVPLHRLEIPHDLWCMNKMEPACRALLRDLNSMEWAVRQSLHAELYEFLAGDGTLMKPVGEIQEDANRALNQQRGQGHVQRRGADDKAGYIGPPTEAFEFALKLIEMHKTEMHRVNNQSGVNTDVTAASRQQSAEAKREETASAENLYRKIGKLIREYVKDLLEGAARGRKEPDAVEDIKVGGMTKFNERSTEGHLENAVVVQSMMIESPTLDKALKLDVAKVHMGDILSQEQLKDIEEELDTNIKEESFEGDGLLTPEEIAAAAAARAAQVEDKSDEDDDSVWA